MWQEPKTDWSADDYINIADYNRIIGNIAYLHDLQQELYKPVPYTELAEKTVSDYPYAWEFNAIESFLNALSDNTFPFVNYERWYWIDNGPTPTYDDLNRIESACLAFYKGYNRQKLTQQKLPITFGVNQSAIKC